MNAVERAALAYVAARVRLVGADASTVVAYAVDVDEAWHALHVVAGHEVVMGCCDDEVEDGFASEAITPRADYL